MDAPDQLAGHCPLAASYAGDLAAFFGGLISPAEGLARPARLPWEADWLPQLSAATAAAVAADSALLTSAASPIHPMRIYGELAQFLDDDAVVIGDGRDFVSYAGKYIEPKRPGAGSTRAHTAAWAPASAMPSGPGLRPAVGADRAALGDGAAGFSLMDVDSLVRHRLPVVMICGNNGIWGLEKHPMQALTATTWPPTCSRSAATTRWSGPWAGQAKWSPSRTASPRRWTGRSAPGCPTWST